MVWESTYSPLNEPTLSIFTVAPAHTLGLPNALPSASTNELESRSSVLCASLLASLAVVTTRSATVTVPPASWPTSELRVVAACAVVAGGELLATPTRSCRALGSWFATRTCDTWPTALIRGLNVSSSSPHFSVAATASRLRLRKLNFRSSTKNSKSYMDARRQQNSQSVSMLCWKNWWTAPVDSTVPADSPAAW